MLFNISQTLKSKDLTPLPSGRPRPSG